MTNQSSLPPLRRAWIYVLLTTFFAACAGRTMAQVSAPSHPIDNQTATPAGTSTVDASPSFDVVSIKPNNTGQPGPLLSLGNVYLAMGQPIEATISRAYLQMPQRMMVRVAGPAWIGSERFDIVAKMDAETAERLRSPTPAEYDAIVQPMLRKMLAVRFGLVVHRAPTEVPGYALTVRRRGSQLVSSQPDDVVPQGAKNATGGAKVLRIGKRGYWPELDYFGMSLASLAQELSITRDMLLVDQTGLKGTYNFKLLPLDEGPIAGDGTSPGDRFEGAIPWDLARLGLQLKPIKYKMETVVVDSIHHPTPN